MAKHKTNPVNTIRNAIVGFIALLVVGVGGYGLLYSSGATDSGGA